MTISYAKYLYTSFHKCDIPKGEEIDHINGDKTDDRIENLQKVSKDYNIQKDHKQKTFVVVESPICRKEFLYRKKDLSSHKNPCCSRTCGGKKSILTKKNKGLFYY